MSLWDVLLQGELISFRQDNSTGCKGLQRHSNGISGVDADKSLHELCNPPLKKCKSLH